MYIFLFVLFLLLGISFISYGIYHAFYNDLIIGVITFILGALILSLSIGLYSDYNVTKIKVNALVESGKYEIVTHDDYSLNELKQFKSIGGVYLKEVN